MARWDDLSVFLLLSEDATSSSAATGTSSGLATVSGIGGRLVPATGTSTGVATVVGLGSTADGAIGTAAGTATVVGLAAEVAATTGTSAGNAAVAGLSNGPGDPIGVRAIENGWDNFDYREPGELFEWTYGSPIPEWTQDDDLTYTPPPVNHPRRKAPYAYRTSTRVS